MSIQTRPALPNYLDPVRIGAGARLLGGLLSGLLAGLGMYVTLAVFALAQGRGAAYPLHAVHGMMSGRRVIPDHPIGSVRGVQVTDFVVAPMLFFIPALIVALVTAGWVAHRHRTDPGGGWAAAAAAPALLVTTLFFLVLVLLLGYKESDASMQRISSGYGVRQLGLVAWLLAHAVYVTVLVSVLGPVSRTVTEWRWRHGRTEPLRDEPDQE